MPEKRTYFVRYKINYNGFEYPASSAIELNNEEARRLLNVGAISDPAIEQTKTSVLSTVSDDLSKKLIEAELLCGQLREQNAKLTDELNALKASRQAKGKK